MLDEVEYRVIADLNAQAIRKTQEFRQRHRLTLAECPIEELFEPVRTEYRELTGCDDATAEEIMHHRIALYGPDCQRCGKPLRSPKAVLCGACGEPAT